MKVKSIAPWFGGKRTLAPAIVEQLGEHTQYFEPFCGSMAVLMAKEPSQKETVNDLHGGLICLARVLADEFAAPQLYDRLSKTLMSEDLLKCARSMLGELEPPWWLHRDDAGELPRIFSYCPQCEKVLDHVVSGKCPQCSIDVETDYCRRSDANMLEFAYWYFIASWMGRNGTAGTARRDYQIAVRWTKNGGSPTVRWSNAVESIPAWHCRLRNVVILRRDAFRILDRFEDHEATAIYVDPPYVIDGDSRSGVKSRGDLSHTYLHEFRNGAGSSGGGLFDTEPDDHQRLRDVLGSYRRARIVVSYYDCQRVRELYDGWTFIDHSRVKHLHNQTGGRGGKDAPELLIINGPSYT